MNEISKKTDLVNIAFKAQLSAISSTIGDVKKRVEVIPSTSDIRAASSADAPVGSSSNEPEIMRVNVKCPFWNMVVDAILSSRASNT